MKLRISLLFFSFITICIFFGCGTSAYNDSNSTPVLSGEISSALKAAAANLTPATSAPATTEPEVVSTEVKMSFLGDCTIGSDTSFGYNRSFYQYYDKNDYSYFFKNVLSVLENDDYTVANLESVLTDSKNENPKKFNYKGPPHYTAVLTQGSVEAVNLANNHSYDFYQSGYLDTIDALRTAGIDYFGSDYQNSVYYVKELKGIKFGFCGFRGFVYEQQLLDLIDSTISALKADGAEMIIATFHGGTMYDYTHNGEQSRIYKYAIDHGVDLIAGAHPHVLQGLEKYNDKLIAYSLGNFCYGGNPSPSDYDGLILQATFYFENKTLIGTDYTLLPVSISSSKGFNDYQPKILEGAERERVLKKIQKDSVNFDCLS